MAAILDWQRTYVGGVYVLPFEPWLDVNSVTVTTLISELRDSIKGVLSQVLSFFYVVYPVTVFVPPSGEKTDYGEQVNPGLHAQVLYNLASIISSTVFQVENPTLDVQVLPVFLHSTDGVSGLSRTQRDVLRDLLVQWKDITHPSFVERLRSSGPVAIFKCPGQVWEKVTESGIVRDSQLLGSVRLLEELEKLAEPLGLPIVFAYPQPSSVYEPGTPPDTTTTERFSFSQANVLVLAGTFDHLHAGHKFLLSVAGMLTKRKLCVAIVQDEGPLLSKKIKKNILQPLLYRANRVYYFLHRFLALMGRRVTLALDPFLTQASFYRTLLAYQDPSSKADPSAADANGLMLSNGSEQELVLPPKSLVSGNGFAQPPLQPSEEGFYADICVELLVLRDAVGPARDRLDFECLIATDDTLGGAAAVNAARVEYGLPALRVLQLPLVSTPPVIIPDLSIHDPRLKDPTSITVRPPFVIPSAAELLNDVAGSPPKRIPKAAPHHYTTPKGGESLSPSPSSVESHSSSSSFCTSSSFIRQALTQRPTVEELSHFWDLIAAVLEFPFMFKAAWGVRLLEHFSAPWRTANRARLVLGMEKLWGPGPLLATDRPFCATDKAWLSVVMWISLVVVTSRLEANVDFHREHMLTREKLRTLLEVFCSDLFSFTTAAFNYNRPHLTRLWRTPQSRVPPLPPALQDKLRENNVFFPSECSCQCNGNVVPDGLRHHDACTDDGSAKTSPNATGVVTEREDSVCPVRLSNWQKAGWRGSVEFLDLHNNIRDVALYLLDGLIPSKASNADTYDRAPSSAATLFVAPSHQCCCCYKSSDAKQQESTATDDAVQGEKRQLPSCVHTDATGVSSFRYHGALLELDRHAQDFVKQLHRTLDLFIYLFFHDSHRVSLSNPAFFRALKDIG